MEDLRYFGRYVRFVTDSRDYGGALVGADNIIGDNYEIEFITEEGVQFAQLKNRFGAIVGRLDASDSRQVGICRARGWTIRALLSFVAFTEHPEPGFYWGEVALICNDKRYDEVFDVFAERVATELGKAVRPDVALGSQGVDKVIEAKGQWLPNTRTDYPKLEAGSVFMKRRRRFSEGFIEAGRAGNKGCYAVSVLFLITVAAAVFFGVAKLIGLV